MGVPAGICACVQVFVRLCFYVGTFWTLSFELPLILILCNTSRRGFQSSLPVDQTEGFKSAFVSPALGTMSLEASLNWVRSKKRCAPKFIGFCF